MNKRAAIWDMDGVIVDSGDAHFHAWQSVFRRHGVDFGASDFRKIFGMRNDAIIGSVLGKLSVEEVRQIGEDKEVHFRGLIKGDARAFPGAVALINSLFSNGYRQSIASSAPLENIEMILSQLKIQDCFQAVVCGTEVPEGKPSPMIFLRAAAKLGIVPAACAVFEDAVAGVQAAKSAGMGCIAVTNTNTREALRAADIVVDSLEQVSISSLEKMLAGRGIK
jgi:beta-phosphoglucomutase family hydrolase